jgi:glycosyltransferase involved in cell wall biosynthesis
MTLRIAHVTATFPPYRGGTGNVCYHNARELARRGHEVHAFTAAHSGAAAREYDDGVFVHRLQPLVQIGNAPVLPGLLSALRGFDIIHLHYPFILGAEMVRLAALLYRAPLVISFHNDLIGDGVRARVFACYQALSARMAVRGAASLCAVSLDHFRSSRLRRALAEGQPPVVALPNGVDTEHFCPSGTTGQVRARYGIPAEARLALFVAALDRAHHFKGFDRLLKAFQRLPADIWLLVAGDGDLRQAYETQARELGIASRIVFAGAVDHGDAPSFFREADATVLPSSPPESFGLVLIESLACGTPVIASDIPGVRTVVSHGMDGLLSEHGSVTSLTSALETLLTAPAARRREMGLSGRAKVVERYHWERIGERLEAIYRQVLCASGPVLSEQQGES